MTLGLFLLIFLAFLFAGIPVGFAMIISGFFYLLSSGDLMNLVMMPEKIFSGINVFVLTAIPFFMLAGDIMNRSGISDRLISFSNIVIGRVRGGLAQVNVLASILFAGITGVALGDIAALGTVFVPAMEKQGYDREFSAGVTAASSLVGPIIPPSVVMVLYAAVMEVSVGGMFLGAIIPGLLIGLTDMAMVAIIASRRKYPKVIVKTSFRMFLFGLKDALLALMMPIIIIGGLLTGVFTPTEAAAVSVAYSIIVGVVVFHSLNWKDLLASLKSAVRSSAKLYLIIAGASVVTWVFGAERVPKVAEQFFLSITTNKFTLILLVNAFFLFMGTWMDPGVSIILFAPILWPIAAKLGLNAVQFGIMIVINTNIGLCTPPVGNVLFAIADLAKVDLFRVSREILPFLLFNLFVVLAVGYFPELTLWLPRLLGLEV
jgi:tripartite ATP-independent transporter DctM subunit